MAKLCKINLKTKNKHKIAINFVSFATRAPISSIALASTTFSENSNLIEKIIYVNLKYLPTRKKFSQKYFHSVNFLSVIVKSYQSKNHIQLRNNKWNSICSQKNVVSMIKHEG